MYLNFGQESWNVDYDNEQDLEEYKQCCSYYENYFNDVKTNTPYMPSNPLVVDNTQTVHTNAEKEKRMKDLQMRMLKRDYTITKDIDEAKKAFTEESKASYILGSKYWMLYQPLFVNGNRIDTLAKVDNCPIIDVDEKEGIKDFNIVNKIPGNLIQEVIASFYTVCQDSGDEAAAQIYRNRKSGEYFIYYPVQTISKASVTYTNDVKPRELRIENELVCELHSHNTMGAFWSSTDNNNEKEVGFYVVIGGMGKEKLEYRARVKYCDSYIDLKLTDLFDLGDTTEDSILTRNNIQVLDKDTADIMKKVHRVSVTTGTYVAPHVSGRYTNPYYNYGSYNGKSQIWDKNGQVKEKEEHKEIQGSLFDLKCEGNDIVYNAFTDRFIYHIALNYCRNNATKRDMFNYLDTNLQLNDLLHATSRMRFRHCLDSYDIMINGKDLPEYNEENIEQYNQEVYVRVSARIVELLAITSCGNIPDNMDEAEKYIKNIDKTDAPNLLYPLDVFWESLTFAEKAILSSFFACTVYDLGSVMYTNPAVSYYGIRFLYTIMMCDAKGRRQYEDFYNAVTSDFADAMVALNGNFNPLEVNTDVGVDVDFSEVMEYLNAASSKMTFMEVFDGKSDWGEDYTDMTEEDLYEMNKDVPLCDEV